MSKYLHAEILKFLLQRWIMEHIEIIAHVEIIAHAEIMAHVE